MEVADGMLSGLLILPMSSNQHGLPPPPPRQFSSACSTTHGACVQVADGVDSEFLILPNGQVAAQQKLTPPRPRAQSPAPMRRSRSLSPKRLRGGLLGKLCGRFRSLSPSPPPPSGTQPSMFPDLPAMRLSHKSLELSKRVLYY